MGEKLAWWFGITKPKFLYEIEEYQRMKKEQEDIDADDRAEEIVLGLDSISLKTEKSQVENENLFEPEKPDKYDQQVNINMENKVYLSDQLFQNN